LFYASPNRTGLINLTLIDNCNYPLNSQNDINLTRNWSIDITDLIHGHITVIQDDDEKEAFFGVAVFDLTILFWLPTHQSKEMDGSFNIPNVFDIEQNGVKQILLEALAETANAFKTITAQNSLTIEVISLSIFCFCCFC